jgi:hypothetical protein
VNLRVTGVGPIAAPGTRSQAAPREKAAPSGHRPCVSTRPSPSTPRSLLAARSRTRSARRRAGPSSRIRLDPCPHTPASGRTLIRSAICSSPRTVP